jgi:hypothetical protein
MTPAGRAVLVALSLLTAAAPVAAQCRSDEILVGEDENNYYCNPRHDRQLAEARAIRDAMDHGLRPSFRALWDYYEFNRDVAEGLAPEQNRCAIVLSMTLGVRPRAGEASLRDLSGGGLLSILSQLRHKLVIPEVGHADIATRYYVQAQQLADRLASEWGQPLTFDGPEARRQIEGRHGVVFLQDAYQAGHSFGRRTGDHIGVWSANHLGDSATTPFDAAAKVWFWEMPR